MRLSRRGRIAVTAFTLAFVGVFLFFVAGRRTNARNPKTMSLEETTTTETDNDVTDQDGNIEHHNKYPTYKPTHAPSSPTLKPTDSLIQPHLIVLLVDDWGYGNVGFRRTNDLGGEENVTPNIDALAEVGVVLDTFYVHHNCAPSRASLQTGRFPIHVNVVNLGPTMYNYDDPDTGAAGIPRYMTGIGTKLSDAGYSTHFVGKWDAGMATWDHTPKGRGYDSSLVYYHHSNDYWYVCFAVVAPSSPYLVPIHPLSSPYPAPM